MMKSNTQGWDGRTRKYTVSPSENTKSRMHYKFVPLEPRSGPELPILHASNKQIRLFRYTNDFPSAATTQRGLGSPTRFLLDVFDLDRCPKYTALSYEWGAESSTQTILVEFVNSGGIRTKQVRKNLHEFLTRLLYDVRENDTRHWTLLEHRPRTSNAIWPDGVQNQWLWADSICIDQMNLEERNNQVSMMSDIFSKASRVIAWLGDDSKLAPKLSFMPDPNYEVDFDVYRCSFWTRLWCQQEVSLANNLVLMAGEHIQPLKNVRRNRSFLRKLDKPGVPRCLHIWSQGESGILPELGLDEAIRFFSAKKCANPRDRIFGVLGMVKREERVAVNYELSVAQVYYAAFLKAFESLLGQGHPSSSHRQAAMAGQVNILRSTFELLAQHMGIPGSETDAMKAIIKVQQSDYYSDREELPSLLQQVRDMVDAVNKHVPGEVQNHRGQELREYFGQKSVLESANSDERLITLVMSDTQEIDSEDEDDEDGSEARTNGYIPDSVSRYLSMMNILDFSVTEPERE